MTPSTPPPKASHAPPPAAADVAGQEDEGVPRPTLDERLRLGELRVLKLIATGAPLLEALDALVRVAEEQSEGMLGSVLFIEDGRLRHASAPHLPQALCRAIDGLAIGPARGSCGTAAYTRAAVIAEDITTDPRWAEHKDLVLNFGLRACWSVPILSADQTVLGTFALYHTKPMRPSERLLEVITNQTHMAAIAIERERNDQAFERQQRALIESESRARAIVENALDAHVLMDSDGKVNSWNAMASKIFGYSAEEALGRKLADLIIPLRDRERHSRGLRHYLASGEGPVLRRRVEVVGLHKSGREIPIELAITPLRLGNRVLFSGFLADISEQNRMEDELRQLQKLEAVGQLTGGVAHDFNNILSVIAAYAESVQRSLHPSDPLQSDVGEILGAGKRGAALTRQLLAFGRKQTLQPRVLDLNVVIAELEKMLGRLLREDIQLKAELAPGLWPILADPSQLEQVIVNLAVNARDAMPDGGKLSISTCNFELSDEERGQHGLLMPGQYVMLVVTDNGCGMEPEVKRRIFEPFFTTKEKDKGSGLGLSTVYGVVKQSGGQIAVFSEPGHGTTFKLYFPRTDAQPTHEPARVQNPEAELAGELVMLVEDEPALRQICERMLKTLRCRVSAFPNAAEALAAAQNNGLRPDLLITDMVMPGLSGKALAERLRSAQPSLKVLYISGFTDDSLSEDGVMPVGTAFLQKPFTIRELSAQVQHILRMQPPK